MASINGIRIKNLKTFKDHEEAICCQGDVFYKSRKLGFWSQDAWGGPDTFRFDESILNDEVRKYAQSDMVEDKYREYASLESLLCTLLEIMEDEKGYKYGLKKGYQIYVKITDGYHIRGYFTNDPNTLESETHKKFLADYTGEFFKDKELKTTVYKSLEDFDIVC